jgi:hypothetical protein
MFYSVLNKSLLSSLLFSIFSNLKNPVDKIDEIFENHQTLTCGRLIKAVENIITLNQETNDLISDALKKRNYLIHSFFYDKAYDFLNDAGRVGMIDELDNMRDIFAKAEACIHGYLEPLLIKYGITQEVLESAQMELLKRYSSECSL